MTKESKNAKRVQRIWLVGVIAACLVSLVVGAFLYISFLNRSLEEQLAQNVMSVTSQQQQAFDRFIANDQERLHSYVEYFSQTPIRSSEDARDMLSLFAVVDAEYTVMCLDEGWARSSRYGEEHRLDEAQLEEYSALTGSGVRNDFTAIFSGTPKFGYYEAFTFAGTGYRGVIQKGYDRNEIQETFSLSFYDDQGYTFVVNQNGDIQMRPAVST